MVTTPTNEMMFFSYLEAREPRRYRIGWGFSPEAVKYVLTVQAATARAWAEHVPRGLPIYEAEKKVKEVPEDAWSDVVSSKEVPADLIQGFVDAVAANLHRFRVVAVDAEGRRSEPSEWRYFLPVS